MRDWPLMRQPANEETRFRPEFRQTTWLWSLNVYFPGWWMCSRDLLAGANASGMRCIANFLSGRHEGLRWVRDVGARR